MPVKKIFPIFFWIQCDNCNKEFKWEMGWKIRLNNLVISTISKTYFFKYYRICKNCADTKEKALELALKSERERINKFHIPPK